MMQPRPDQTTTCDSSVWKSCVAALLQSLLQQGIYFDKVVQLTGQLYLTVDHNYKLNYLLDETFVKGQEHPHNLQLLSQSSCVPQGSGQKCVSLPVNDDNDQGDHELLVQLDADLDKQLVSHHSAPDISLHTRQVNKEELVNSDVSCEETVDSCDQGSCQSGQDSEHTGQNVLCLRQTCGSDNSLVAQSRQAYVHSEQDFHSQSGGNVEIHGDGEGVLLNPVGASLHKEIVQEPHMDTEMGTVSPQIEFDLIRLHCGDDLVTDIENAASVEMCIETVDYDTQESEATDIRRVNSGGEDMQYLDKSVSSEFSQENLPFSLIDKVVGRFNNSNNMKLRLEELSHYNSGVDSSHEVVSHKELHDKEETTHFDLNDSHYHLNDNKDECYTLEDSITTFNIVSQGMY